MNASDAYSIISYFLLFYVIARLEWLNYKIGKLEGKICAEKGKEKGIFHKEEKILSRPDNSIYEHRER